MGSRAAVGNRRGAPVPAQPRAVLLKVGRRWALPPASPRSSAYSGKASAGLLSSSGALTGAGLGVLLKPPKGVATLEVLD